MHVSICFIYHFLGFPKNLYLGKFIACRQIFLLLFFLKIFTVKLELFLLCHVALLSREFVARIFVHVVAFLLMLLLETGDFDNLTHLKLIYKGWLNMLIM